MTEQGKHMPATKRQKMDPKAGPQAQKSPRGVENKALERRAEGVKGPATPAPGAAGMDGPGRKLLASRETSRWEGEAPPGIVGTSGRNVRPWPRILQGPGLAPILEEAEGECSNPAAAERVSRAPGPPTGDPQAEAPDDPDKMKPGPGQLKDPNAKATKNDDAEVRVDLWVVTFWLGWTP